MSSDGISRRTFAGLACAAAGTVLASISAELPSGCKANESDGQGASDGERIVILHTNDVHCAFENAQTHLGYAAFADYAREQRAVYGEANVALVDAGDNLQGEPEATITKGSAPMQVMASCGYDAITCGNHEFDYGVDRFLELCREQDLPYVCCNLLDADGTRVFDAYRLLDFQTSAGPVRIGFVGVLTPATPAGSLLNNFKDDQGQDAYLFCGDDDGSALYEAIQAAVDEARTEGGADYVVLLAHLGQTGIPQQWRSDTVVANTSGIDIVIDGHSHEQYVQTAENKDGQTVIITQTGTKFQSFGRIEIDPLRGTATASHDATGIDASLVEEVDGSDSEMAELIERVEEEVDQAKAVVVGTSEFTLRAQEDDGQTWSVRLHETNLGDLYADAALNAVRKAGTACDLALVSTGSMLVNLGPGDLTYGEFMTLTPYTNQLVCLEVSGQHVLDMLEVAAMGLPEASTRFLQVSEGMSLEIRTDIPSPVILTEDESAVEKIEGDRRVSDASIDGVAIDPEVTYAVASSNYVLLNGGYAMPVPQNAGNATVVGSDIEALMEYIQTDMGGAVSQEYADEAGFGRMRVVQG